MRVLVAYATKHGATEGIAERIGEDLATSGHDVDVRPVHDVKDPRGYDAYVVGSAAYARHWRHEARSFLKGNVSVLAEHPVWLFSSGPLGTGETDPDVHDLRDLNEPREVRELEQEVRPRGHRVFFGKLDPDALTAPERLLRALPAGRALLPEGDFRDWDDIDGWAASIDEELRGA
jgi:menaquinone-dependent protoporphyrinogen oxidase